MRQSLLSRLARRSKRQGQVGQTIVIMAFGFIVLLAFVGIVTDVSLMFVRYTTLRRAVDAAAVAAAGQVRRTLPNAAETAKAVSLGHPEYADGYAFARNVANINLAARQFIEFYGLSPSNVSVDSCDTLNAGPPSPPAPPPPPPDDAKKALMTLLECRKEKQPRKMVRVTAQLQSPTVFLRLIGWGTVTLEASAISETAVLDIVLIFDTAETMLKQTTYNDWETVPKTNGSGGLVYKSDGVTVDTFDQSLRFLPVRINTAPNWNGNLPLYDNNMWSATGGLWPKAWTLLLNKTQQQIYDDKATFPEVAFAWDGSNATVVNPDTDPRAPRKDCRVRFFPYSGTIGPAAMTWLKTDTSPVTNDLQNSYTALLRSKTWNDPYDGNKLKPVLTSAEQYPNRYDGFMPAYDYFGCCNDPNGDNKFDDLICQPFKKVRDATEKFMDHVDFVRGDRVAFVTFDRTAFLVDPDGEKGPQLPMITSQDNAEAALRRIVGVRAEPYYYADYTSDDKDGIPDGKWDSMVTGATAYTGLSTGGIPISYYQRYDFAKGVLVDDKTATDGKAGYNNTKLGALNDYPVKYNCYWENATLEYPKSLYSSQAQLSDYNLYYPDQVKYSPFDATLPYIASRWPTPLAAMGGTPMMNPNLNLTAWDNSMKSYEPKPYSRQASKGIFSYEFRAGCAGNNVGAALRVGNNALLDPRTVRIGNTGAVWVMVLLGDGAAGASDPVIRNGPLYPGNPYGEKVTDKPVPGDYGAYGLCPFGTPEDQMGLTAGWQARPPRCSDDGSEPSNGGTRGIMGPSSRHFCQGSAIGDNDNSTIDIGTSGEHTEDCVTKYDVDDYARDWADFIGLTNLPSVSPFTKLRGVDESRSLLQLPTIFTIGFGLDFSEDPVWQCANSKSGPVPLPDEFTNINDCLGEELLRYIADVGDNNRIDTDYQQDYLNDTEINGITDNPEPNSYGDRGPCEASIGYVNADVAKAAGAFSSNFNLLRTKPLPPRTSCGNYYNAPSGADLAKVFEDIASRMFTRITK